MKKPESFGKYLLRERTALTQTTEVWRAILKSAGGFEKEVSLKRVHPPFSEDKEFARNFIQNARISALLNHANIVQVLDLGAIDNRLYLAEEYLQGRDLRSLLNKVFSQGKTVPYPAMVFIAIEILKALEYVHSKNYMTGRVVVPMNIVHGNLSPSSIFLTWEGGVKIGNFMTRRGEVTPGGTVSKFLQERIEYSSPEEIEGEGMDARADIFSCGIIFYEALTGVNPFRAAKVSHVLDNIRRRNIPPVTTFNSVIPLALDRIVMYAIEKDRGKRFQTASHCRQALEKFLFDNQVIYTNSDLSELLSRWFRAEFPPERLRERRAIPVSLPGRMEGGIREYPGKGTPPSLPGKEVEIEDSFDMDEETPREARHSFEATVPLDLSSFSRPSAKTAEPGMDEEPLFEDDEKTIIVESLQARADSEKTVIRDVSGAVDETTRIVPGRLMGQEPSRAPSPPPGVIHEGGPPSVRVRRSRLIYIAASIILAFSILFVYIGESGRSGRRGAGEAGNSFRESGDIRAGEGAGDGSALLKVVLPPLSDTTITMDGDLLEGTPPFELKLKGSVPHTLRIVRKGYSPITHEINLKPGESHILYLDFLMEEKGVER